MLLTEITLLIKGLKESDPQYPKLHELYREAILASSYEEFQSALNILQSDEKDILRRLQQIKKRKN